MSEHTPGLWGTFQHTSTGEWVIYDDATHQDLAIVFSSDNSTVATTPEQARANARLIACPPAMDAALREAVEAMERVQQADSDFTDADDADWITAITDQLVTLYPLIARCRAARGDAAEPQGATTDPRDAEIARLREDVCRAAEFRDAVEVEAHRPVSYAAAIKFNLLQAIANYDGAQACAALEPRNEK